MTSITRNQSTVPDKAPVDSPACHVELLWAPHGTEPTGMWHGAGKAQLVDRRQEIGFDLPDELHESPWLRIVLHAAPGFFHIYRVALVTNNGTASPDTVWQTQTLQDLAAVTDIYSGKICRSAVGEVIMSTGANPELIIKPPREHARAKASTYRVLIELDAPHSWDYAAAKEFLLQEEQVLRDQLTEQATRLAKLEKAATELETIKRSKVWRIAEALRKAVYLTGLSRFPRLQSSLLAVTRRGLGPALQALTAGVRQHGPFGYWHQSGVAARTTEAHDTNLDYRRFRQLHQLTDERAATIAHDITAFERRPLISIVMPVYNAPLEWLRRAISSVETQLYENWELCIVDDCSTQQRVVDFLKSLNHPRMRVRLLKQNKNIAGATNEAIAMCTGEYIALLDNDDELTIDALFEVVAAINAQDPDMIYSDEDFIDLDGELSNPHFKPDFSPDLLLSHNYITHLLVLQRGLLDRAGLLDSRYDGAQDYDLVLRASEMARCVHHIPKVLYHWRQSEGSTSFDEEAKPKALVRTRRVLEETLRRRGIEGTVEPANMRYFFRIKREIPDDVPPLVSIIVPFKDQPKLLEACVQSILNRSTYSNFEIIGISNNSERPETFALMRQLAAEDRRIRFLEYNVPFNFSKINNYGVSQAKGEYVVLLNNDVEIISWDWIESMLEHSMRVEVGVVGGKLYYPDHSIQHAGIIVGIGGYAGHAHKHFLGNRTGYFNRLHLIQDVSAVTGAWMMVKKSLYEELGGLDEKHLGVACNDVDFCLRARELGYYNIFTPYAEAYHHESKSRGYEDTPEKIARFEREKGYFQERHKEILERGDPFYNPNLALDSEGFELRLN